MKAFGSSDWISFVPGNHDTYVRTDWQHGLSHLADYMQGDMKVKFTQSTPQITTPFPYVRLRRNVASSGFPPPCRSRSTAPPVFSAPPSSDALEILLKDLRERGFARVVMIHHPPLPGSPRPRKALIDAGQLRTVLEAQGAELVLHGHNHEHMQTTLATRSAPSTSWACRRPPWPIASNHPLRDGTSTAPAPETAAGSPTSPCSGLDANSRKLVTLGEYTLST